MNNKECENIHKAKSCNKDIYDMSIEELNEEMNTIQLLFEENHKKENELYNTLRSLREAKDNAYQAYIIKNNIKLTDICMCKNFQTKTDYLKILSISNIQKDVVTADTVVVTENKEFGHSMGIYNRTQYLNFSDIFENKCTEDEFNNVFLKAIDFLKSKVSIVSKEKINYYDAANLIQRTDKLDH